MPSPAKRRRAPTASTPNPSRTADRTKATGTKATRRAPPTRASSQPIPPPPGWKAIEDLPVPKPDPEPDLMTDLRRAAATEIAAGYNTPRQVVKHLVELYEDQLSAPKLRKLLRPVLEEERERHEQAQAGWPAVTDCDRLDAAFADLECRGVLARQNYWCCGTCGCAAIDDEMKARLRKKKPVRGYAFFHWQDTESAVTGHGLMLNYGAVEGDEDSAVAIGREIVQVLRAHKLRTSWKGLYDYRIGVKLDWKRRSPH